MIVRLRLAKIEASLGSLIEDLVEKHQEVSEALTNIAQGGEPPSPVWIRLLEVYSMTASRIGRLLRDKAVLEGDPADERQRLLNKALDQLREDVGWDV